MSLKSLLSEAASSWAVVAATYVRYKHGAVVCRCGPFADDQKLRAAASASYAYDPKMRNFAASPNYTVDLKDTQP